MSSFFFMVAPFCARLGPLDEPVWSGYFLFTREPEPLAIPLLPTDLAERMLWGYTVRGAPHLVRARSPSPCDHFIDDCASVFWRCQILRDTALISSGRR